MNLSRFKIAKVIVGFDNLEPANEYVILENYLTSEGYRTRIVGKTFRNKEECLAWAHQYFKDRGIE